jgi:hypothetical protein
VLSVSSIDPYGLQGEDDSWWFVAILEDGDERARLRVRVTDSTAVVAGFGPQGPSVEWVHRTLLRRLTTVREFKPALPHVRAWSDPLYLHA